MSKDKKKVTAGKKTMKKDGGKNAMNKNTKTVKKFNTVKTGGKDAQSLFFEDKTGIRKDFKPEYKLVKFFLVDGTPFYVRSCIAEKEYSLTVDHTVWTATKKRAANKTKLGKSFEDRFGKI